MTETANTTDEGRLGTKTVLIAIIAFSICSMTAAVKSKGFLESDGGTHYLYARHAFSEPYYFVDVWGWPLCTALFALPATFGGLIAVRFTSLATAIGIAIIAWLIARGQRYKYPALAVIFTFGMPLLFLHSISELTELPFALVLGAALLAYQRRWFLTMALLAAVAPLGRPEGFGVLILAAAALVTHRKWIGLLILPLGLVAWSIYGRHLVGPHDIAWWHWLADHWPYDQTSPYPSGNPLHFALRLPMLIGPLLLPAMWVGMYLSLRCGRAALRDHRQRVQFIIAMLPLGFLVIHSALFWLGKFSSSGELRYLLVAAPMWALCGAMGWEWAFKTFHWRGAARWAALAAIVPGLVNFSWRILPLEPETSWLEAQRVADWYKSDAAIRAKYPRILCNHPGLYFYLDLSPTDSAHVVTWSAENAAHPPKGVMLLWDPEFCVLNASSEFIVPLPDVMRAGWVNDWADTLRSNANNPPPWANYKVAHPPARPRGFSLPDTPMLWHLFLSPQREDGSTTPSVVRKSDGAIWRETPGYPLK